MIYIPSVSLKTALIVEDSKIAALAIRKALELDGYAEFIFVERGDLALSSYTQIKPDIVTMDINMPGADGFTAATEILEFDRNANIIIITEKNLEEGEKERLADVKDILLKPVSVAKIKAALAKI